MAQVFERMSIFCRDMEASLAFYVGALGLVCVEDKVIEGAAAGGLVQLPPCRMHIAFLAPTVDEHVILGLFELSGVPVQTHRAPEGQPLYGQASLVLSTREFDAIHARLQAAGSRFLTPPVRYPKQHANERSPAGIYHEMIFYDPDGVLVSVLQIDPLDSAT